VTPQPCAHSDTDDFNVRLFRDPQTGAEWTAQTTISFGSGSRLFCAECVGDALEALGVQVVARGERIA
jgi:hypothetical protein